MSRCKFKIGDRVVLKRNGWTGTKRRHDTGTSDPNYVEWDSQVDGRVRSGYYFTKDLDHEVVVDEIAEYFT